MDKFHEWAKTCLNKKRMSEHLAELVIYRARQQGTELYKYICPHCNGWHVTKQKRKQ